MSDKIDLHDIEQRLFGPGVIPTVGNIEISKEPMPELTEEHKKQLAEYEAGLKESQEIMEELAERLLR